MFKGIPQDLSYCRYIVLPLMVYLVLAVDVGIWRTKIFIIVVVVVVVVVVRCLSFWSSFFHLLLVAYCIFAEHVYLLILADGWCGCDVCK